MVVAEAEEAQAGLERLPPGWEAFAASKCSSSHSSLQSIEFLERIWRLRIGRRALRGGHWDERFLQPLSAAAATAACNQ